MARILVVDDDEFFVTIMMQALKKDGHDVAFAYEGFTGMKAFDVFGFDAVVCDMMMPEQDGEETIKQLRASRPDIAIVAISGGFSDDKTDILDIARKQGADVTLKKPFLLQALTAAVDNALAERKRNRLAAIA